MTTETTMKLPVVTQAMREARAAVVRAEVLLASVALDRLDQGLRVLSNLSEHDRTEHWNMEEWATLTPCGTIGCAGGHMAMDPWFNEHGLYLVFTDMLKPDDCHCVDCQQRAMRGQLSIGPQTFFGRLVCDVMTNSYKRPVETVIAELHAVRSRYAALPPGTDVRYYEPTP